MSHIRKKKTKIKGLESKRINCVRCIEFRTERKKIDTITAPKLVSQKEANFQKYMPGYEKIYDINKIRLQECLKKRVCQLCHSVTRMELTYSIRTNTVIFKN